MAHTEAADVSDPSKFSFQLNEDGKLPLESAVFQALGAASMCWSETPKGIFDSTRAKEIGEALLLKIRAEEDRIL